MDAEGAAGEVSFVKTMKKTYLKAVTIPASFVRQHGGRFSVNCKLGYAETKPRWEVTVHVNFMKNKPHVSFGGGWKAFARAHNIQVGDRLKFTLIEQGGFNVHHVTADGTTVIDISSDED